MSRPSSTPPLRRPRSCWRRTRTRRTAGTAGTLLAAMLISGVRIIAVTSSPLSRTRGGPPGKEEERAIAGNEVDAGSRGEVFELRFIARVDVFARGGERERAVHGAGVDVRD